MNAVPITQFHSPRGHHEQVSCEVTDKAWAAWLRIKECDLRVTAEVLRTGPVSLCLEHPDAGDYDCRLADNGPSLCSPPTALERLLLDFNADEFHRWLSTQLGAVSI